MEASALIAALLAVVLGTTTLGVRFLPRARHALLVRRLARPDHDPGAALGTPTIEQRFETALAAASPPLPCAEARAVVLCEQPLHLTDDQLAAAVAALAAGDDDDRAGVVALGLTLGHLRGLPWRKLLRRLPAVEGTSDEARAVEAERCLALGHHDRARSIIAELPADHWRACRVRGCLYALSGDAERSASAHHAAWALAPATSKPAAERGLGAGFSVRPA